MSNTANKLTDREQDLANNCLADEFLMRRMIRETPRSIVRELWRLGGGNGSYFLDLIAEESGVLLGDYMEKVSIPCTTPVSGSLRAEIFARDGHACLHCGTKRDLTIDHITPRTKGGTNNRSNLQILCRSCNSRKGIRI